ncbi:hypothetical protein TRAPUB_8189 [Trametes pubescens]|uniref:Uncharacterized protein n=1 Tax=Trametes pubescens TaxID=154538 RepID=A0A1M2W5Z4_TRAPU|nr:hypothetical protein TRAPUB_8189 [Trametes pubescens]
MDGRPTQPPDKVPPPPPRPPLITPSLSPPGSRVFPRIPDRPAPLKRPRLSSTPSSSASARLPPPPPPPRDLRLESSNRLFAFWDQLAARYNKPLDEDDIVDLRDLAFVKDRGVTRAAAQSYEIGSFASAGVDDASSQGAEDENETSAGEENAPEDDESADELDLISPPPVESVVQEKLQYYKNWVVPPADEQNPEDAEAFREFEEAEKQRKELYGDDEEEGDEGPEEDGFANTDGPTDEEESVPSEAEPPPSTRCDSESVAMRSVSPAKPTPQRPKSRPPPRPAEDDSSDDELAEWVIDDTPIPPRRAVPPPDPDDLIDLTLSRSPSPAPPLRGRSQSRPRLQSVAPFLPRSQSQPRARAKFKPQLQVSPRPRSASPQALQLLTPPRSSCSAPSDPPEMGIVAVRTETPSPKMPRPRPRYAPQSRTVGESEKAGEHGDSRPGSPVPDVTPSARKMSTKMSRASLKPEVVIMVPRTGSHRGKTPVRPDSPEVPLSVEFQASRQARQNGEAGPSSQVKGKGKEVAPRAVTPESPPVPPSSRRTPLQTRSVSEESCSPQPVPPKGRKRRRVASSSSSDGSPEKLSSSKPLARKQLQRTSERRSGHSSDAAPPTSSPVHSDYEDEAPIPALSIYPSEYPPYVQRPDHQRANSVAHGPHPPHPHPPHPAFPPMSLQQSQAIAAMFSYYMASGGLFQHMSPPSGPAYHPGPPPPFYGMPQTPSHRGHPPRHSQGFNTPSSEAGPSRSSTYSTPSHYPHAYPYWFDPSYSSGTLPPSSPIPSSPMDSSPILRPASVPPGQRSKARGRRVSFKLDAKDRPLSDGDSIGGDRASDDDAPTHTHRRRSQTPANPSKGKSKGKGKARAAPPSDEGEADEDGQEDAGRAGPSPPRARTPGPPGRREQSVPRGGSGRSIGKATSAKKKTK